MMDNIQELKKELDKWRDLAMKEREEKIELREKYHEIIMKVESKFSGETRHETALRYVKSCEKGSNHPAKKDGE